MVAMPGCWKNFEDLEENLSLPELEAILNAFYKARREEQIFLAGLQGIDIEKHEMDARIKKVQDRANATIRGENGLTAADMEWDELGIDLEIEEE